MIGKKIVVVYDDDNPGAPPLTMLGTLKNVDDFFLTVEDDYGNVQLIAKRSIVRIRVKNGGG